MQAAGISLVTPEGLALFLKRGATADHPGTWCWPGGGIEGNETAEEAARRETSEETGYSPEEKLTTIDHQANDEDAFTTFHHGVSEQFLPRLNNEHTGYAWAPLNDPPEPLHPGVKATLGKLSAQFANDCLMAFDRAPENIERLDGRLGIAFDKATVRSMDRDGRMHVSTTNISKAAVNPYLGKEIPDWQSLGLEADTIYQLYRDPDELEKGAPTFNNLPLLSKHVEVNALDHKPDLVIGSTGSHSEFVAPYLRNSLVIWANDAIEAVEAERQKELSSAYRYRADMTPGVSPEGEKYDGVMRDIIGNHVALVKEGRAGADVVVGDSKEEVTMSKTLLTHKAAMLRGSLAVFLKPRLALDSKPALDPIFVGLTAKNFKEKKPEITAALKKMLTPMLAKDSKLDGLVELIDAIGDEPVVDAVESDVDPIIKEDKNDQAMDDPMAAIKALLDGKVPDEDIAKILELCGGEKVAEPDPIVGDDPPPFAGMPKKPDIAVAKDKDMDEDKPMTKTAMDAAISKASKIATDNALKVAKEIREAERVVRPYVGDIAIACDSAEGVYRLALGALEVDVEGIHASALPAILKMQPLPDQRRTVKTNVAMDAAGEKSFAERHPDASRIKTL